MLRARRRLFTTTQARNRVSFETGATHATRREEEEDDWYDDMRTRDWDGPERPAALVFGPVCPGSRAARPRVPPVGWDARALAERKEVDFMRSPCRM
jgi:hypothetical protein